MKHARPDYDRIQDPAGLIPEDEPVFLLRGQDVFAPQCIRDWANSAEANMPPSPSRDRMVKMARLHAEAMQEWQVDHHQRVKYPDLPEPSPALAELSADMTAEIKRLTGVNEVAGFPEIVTLQKPFPSVMEMSDAEVAEALKSGEAKAEPGSGGG